jgi:hypothetical protein
VCTIERMELFGSTSVGASDMLAAPMNHLATPMNHKGVEHSLARSETPEIWKWQFRIGNLVKSGRTEARLPLLAMRRVQLKIDLELKHTGQELTS